MRSKELDERYARAIISLVDKNQFDLLSKDIETLRGFISSNPGILTEISSVLIQPANRLAIAQELSKGLNLPDLWDNAFKVLIQKSRFCFLQDILIEMSATLLAKSNKLSVHLTLAHDINDAALANIRTRIEKILEKEVVFETSIEPHILGGFIAESESCIIDGSVRHNLDNFKKLLH